MLHPRLSHFNSIKNCGIIRSHVNEESTPTFRRYNIIFGFNGSGKTTLSRIFRSLEQGTLDRNLPPGSQFSITLNDVSTIKSNENIDLITDQIKVFNSDFVTENLRWSEATADPVFYIGPEAAKRSRLLERFRGLLPKRLAEREAAAAVLQERANSLAKSRTDLARTINLELKLTTYNAPKLQADLQSEQFTNAVVHSDSELKASKELALQNVPLQKLEVNLEDTHSFITCLKFAEELLKKSISQITLGEFEAHSAMIKWAKEGLDYHEQKLLETCLFCGNSLTEDRKICLHEVLDANVSQFFDYLAESRRVLEERLSQLRVFKTYFPYQRQLAPDLVDEYATCVEALLAWASNVEQKIVICIKAIERKSQNLVKPISFTELGIQGVYSNVDSLTRYVVTAVKIIEKHNEYQEEFELRKRKAIEAVKFSIIRASFDDLKGLEEACDDSKRAFDTSDRLASKLKAVISSLETAVRHHGPAVPEINRLLAEYLGHSEISLAPLEVGYEIRRSGVRLDGPLSEGERTAIALCYFVCKIKENGRGVKDFIIVVDDPVSSMDFSSLYYAYCMIKIQLFEARQIIIMTHNIDFLNEAKRWMRSENDKIERSNKKNKEDAEVPAEFFSLFVKEDKLEQWRASSIGRMPKALRVYESEYHYLFSVLMDFHGANGEISNGSEFMVPHIIRRALELFLAFKILGSDGLEAKLQHDVIKKSGVSVERLMALLRISHSGSHSDNVDGIVKLKPISSEEMLKATKALFDLMKALDELHFERLLKVCKESSA